MKDVTEALRGGKLGEVRSRADRCAVSLTANDTVVFSVDPSARPPALSAEVEDRPIEGDQIFEDGEGRKIVRVVVREDSASIHFEDGEIFHVLAVENEDGIRLATREEREHSRGARSLLDKFLGRFR